MNLIVGGRSNFTLSEHLKYSPNVCENLEVLIDNVITDYTEYSENRDELQDEIKDLEYSVSELEDHVCVCKQVISLQDGLFQRLLVEIKYETDINNLKTFIESEYNELRDNEVFNEFKYI